MNEVNSALIKALAQIEDPAKTKAVIAETHGFYKALLEGKVSAGKLWLPSNAA